MLKNAVNYSHIILKEILQSGDNVVDATMGNGKDTYFLSQCVKEKGHVYAFDIQASALKQTKTYLLEKKAYNNVSLHLKSHSQLNEIVDTPIKGAIFNLGYLPTGDKTIITQKESTLKALDQVLSLLLCGGRIVFAIYTGHKGGIEEKEALLAYCKTLPQETYTVLRYQFMNQKNNPPFLLIIEKKR